MYKKISVVGLGYIGLPTAAMFASKGLEVIGVDVNETAIEMINAGKIHIVEPDLDEVVHQAVKNQKLKAVPTPEKAEAFIIAVPTPFKGEEKTPDLCFIKSAADAIAPVLEPGNLVVLESTSPVGATRQLEDWLAEKRPDLIFPSQGGDAATIRIAYCPERVLPGKVMQELITNDRIIGGITPACSQAAVNLYEIFVEANCIVASSPNVAEMAKLTENSFRDVNIAFANELSLICDELDVNVWELIALSNKHPRVNILQPGPGVGGHCIAVDPWFIVSSAPETAQLIHKARIVNDSKPFRVRDQVDAAIAKFISENPSMTESDVCIACYGIAFKPNIDDLRESPALEIVKDLSSKSKGKIIVVEPNLTDVQKSNLEQLNFVGFNQAKEDADIHLMLVDHSQFNGSERPEGILVDTRGVWSSVNVP